MSNNENALERILRACLESSTQAMLEKCRRLWKNCEGKLNTSLQFMVLAFLVIILKIFSMRL